MYTVINIALLFIEMLQLTQYKPGIHLYTILKKTWHSKSDLETKVISYFVIGQVDSV